MFRPLLILKLFHRAARIQRKRMTLTVMAITWGTISIILLLSFGEGLKRSMATGKRGTGAGILVIWPGLATLWIRHSSLSGTFSAPCSLGAVTRAENISQWSAWPSSSSCS